LSEAGHVSEHRVRQEFHVLADAEQQGAENHAFDHAERVIRHGDDRAAPGNAVQVAGGALALDAEAFQKLLEKLLAGGLEHGVGPDHIQLFGQEKLFEKAVYRGFREKGASGV
jgi:hypothetical protein